MRKALWVIAVALSATLSPVLKADTTYTVNQTFNVDGGAVVGNCNPLGSDCSASTAYITGTITTDGSTGLLSPSDIILSSLEDGAGSYSSFVDDGIGGGYPSGTNLSGLYAYDGGLFFVGAQGGSFSTAIGNGFYISESVSPGSPLLDLLVDMGDVGVTGSTPLSNGIVTIATVTPEPGTAIFYSIGLVLIFLLRWRGFTGPRSVQVSEM